jgi:hypothetical protein
MTVIEQVLSGELKQVWQLKEGDMVKTPNGEEAVISIKRNEKDARITYIRTESGIWDSYTYGYVL